MCLISNETDSLHTMTKVTNPNFNYEKTMFPRSSLHLIDSSAGRV